MSNRYRGTPHAKPAHCRSPRPRALDTNVDAGFPVGLPLEQAGIFGQFQANLSVTYGGGTLTSLDILAALGTYDFTGLTVFGFTVDDGGFNAMGLVFSETTISTAQPCPWDCEPVPDGEIGITDFLELLAQWFAVDSSCDFDGGGVGITDFLKLLANWGGVPC